MLVWPFLLLPLATQPDLAAFDALRRDPPPDALTRDTHYWVSNETRLELFRPEVEGRGGIHVGVGTDQNFILAGWSRPEVMVLMDFDQAIVDLHHAYRAAFLAADTKEAFMRLWTNRGRKDLKAAIAAHTDDPRRQARARRVAVHARWVIARRIERILAFHKDHQTFLTDDETYAFVRSLYQQGRVFMARGDLTARRTMQDIAEAAQATHKVVRVLYLSNAEQYFDYDKAFRSNIASLPLDGESVIVRTSGLKNFDRVPGTYYHYNVQTGPSFQSFVGDKPAKNVNFMLRHREPTRHLGFSRLTRTAAEARGGVRPIPRASDFPDAPPVTPCLAAPPPGMACVPAGPFIRGRYRSDDGPSHPPAESKAVVYMSTFYMDKNEVTYEAFKACEKAKQCLPGGPNYQDFDAPTQPVNGVNWYAAQSYCKAQGKQLPTEAQWEKAARGTDGRLYPWGDEPADCARAVIKDKTGRSCGIKQKSKTFAKVGRPDPVGARPPAVHGLYDMAGNSWEWTADWFTKSWRHCGKRCLGIDPRGPCAGQKRCGLSKQKVVRGGSWYWDKDYATTTHRRPHYPRNRPFHHFGFRCAATAEQAAALVEK